MSKNRVIVLAVLEGGMSKSEAARRYGVGRQWVHELLARSLTEGDAGLEPRSRKPRTYPQATDQAVRVRTLVLRAELAGQGLDAGAETIAAHLEREGRTPRAKSTIHGILRDAGTVVPEPHKRPRSSLRRFTAAQPNEMWQSDFACPRMDTEGDSRILARRPIPTQVTAKVRHGRKVFKQELLTTLTARTDNK